MCSTLHAWLLIPQRSITSLAKQPPALGFCSIPEARPCTSRPRGKPAISPPQTCLVKAPRSPSRQKAAFLLLHRPPPLLSFSLPTSAVSQSRYCVALLSVSHSLGSSPLCCKALSVMSFVWKVIHRTKLHCVLGLWQSTSIIMSIRDFIIAWGPWCQNEGLQRFQNR